MAQDNSILISFGVQSRSIVVGGVSTFRHHPHVDEPQEFAYCVYVLLAFVGCDGLCVELQLKIGVKNDPYDFVCISADRLLYSLPFPIWGELTVPPFVIGFQFIDFT